MFGARDIVWAAAVCLLLNLALYYRPLWGARSFIRDEAKDGFGIAYDGHRFINGQPIKSPLKAGTIYDPMKVAVMKRRFRIDAEHMSWNGKEAEFVVRHTILINGSTDEDSDVSYDAHVKLERVGSSWEYNAFEIRGGGEVGNLTGTNPFATAARLSRQGG